jgi:hypothetical protein
MVGRRAGGWRGVGRRGQHRWLGVAAGGGGRGIVGGFEEDLFEAGVGVLGEAAAYFVE